MRDGQEQSKEGMGRAKPTPIRRLQRNAFGEGGAVVYAFTVSRLSLLVIGLLAQIYIRPLTSQGNPLRLSPHQVLNIWGAWDTGWYVDLALHGYQRAPGADGQANWAFFPAFPTLAATLARLTGLPPFEAMLVISNSSFFLALVLLHRLGRTEFDKKTADIAVAVVCVLPGSYIFSAAYTESLFLLCTVAALLAMRARRWIIAGSIAAIAVLTRNLGLGLLLPYAWAVLERLAFGEDSRRNPAGAPAPLSELLRMAGGGVLPLAALGAFAAFLNARTGDAFAFMHVQSAWSRDLAHPFQELLQDLTRPKPFRTRTSSVSRPLGSPFFCWWRWPQCGAGFCCPWAWS